MGRPAPFRLAIGLLGVALAVSAKAGPHGAFLGPGIPPRSPQVMLYFSHAIGGLPGATSARPQLGIRFQQVRQAGNSGDPQASGDPMEHREWLGWQVDAPAGFHLSDLHPSNMQLKLGSRVAYDVTGHRFESLTSSPGMPLQTASPRAEAVTHAPPALGDPFHSAGEGLPDTQGTAPFLRPAASSDNPHVREIAAAAMAAMPLGKFRAAQRQTTTAPRMAAPAAQASWGR